MHNYLVTVDGAPERLLRKDVWIVYHGEEGAKSHGMTQEQKYLRDAKLLEDYLALHPGDPRSQFYLAQSYRDAGHLERAYEEYAKRAALEGWAEEKFMAQLEVGRLAIRLEKPEAVVLEQLLAAHELRPSRAEPVYELARYFRIKKAWAKAYLFAKGGVPIQRPDDLLFVVHSVYDWQLLDELGVCSFWVGEYEVCRAACSHLLQRIAEGLAVPAADAERIRENLRCANAKLRAP